MLQKPEWALMCVAPGEARGIANNPARGLNSKAAAIKMIKTIPQLEKEMLSFNASFQPSGLYVIFIFNRKLHLRLRTFKPSGLINPSSIKGKE
jgi:hypothetical protein